MFSEDILSHNLEKFGDETLSLIESNTYWTTKAFGGCLPYWFLSTLVNGGRDFITFDPITRRHYDIFTLNLQYMKRSCNLIIEITTMHQNPGSDGWQNTSNLFSERSM